MLQGISDPAVDPAAIRLAAAIFGVIACDMPDDPDLRATTPARFQKDRQSGPLRRWRRKPKESPKQIAQPDRIGGQCPTAEGTPLWVLGLVYAAAPPKLSYSCRHRRRARPSRQRRATLAGAPQGRDGAVGRRHCAWTHGAPMSTPGPCGPLFRTGLGAAVSIVPEVQRGGIERQLGALVSHSNLASELHNFNYCSIHSFLDGDCRSICVSKRGG